MSRVRNLVIGFDGTWNEPDQTSGGKVCPTNVTRFLDGIHRGGGMQEIRYEEGVGTRNWEALSGGIYGEGLDKRVLDAYRYLRRSFANPAWKGDTIRIFLLGFSRGSYAARRTAGLLHFCGIPHKASDVPIGWRVFLEQDPASAADLRTGPRPRFFDVEVEMVGVWDTVKATNDPDFHDHRLPGNVKKAYHALSIDEQRRFFPALRWDADPRVHEVWFAGVHSDVGGGYADPGLSDFALRWMYLRGHEHGLKFTRSSLRSVKPNAKGPLHDSMTGIWQALGRKRRPIPATAGIHGSVRTRMQQVATYRPKNLPADPTWVGDFLPT